MEKKSLISVIPLCSNSATFVHHMNERPNYIDLAKVLGMFCVFLGHFIYYLDVDFVPNSSMVKVTYFVTLFHMPFFFFVTGVVSSFKMSTNFLTNQFRALLLPYILWGLILGLGYSIFEFFKSQNSLEFIKFLIAFFSGSDFKGCVLFLVSPLWFLYALFFIKILVGIGASLKRKILRVFYFSIFVIAGVGMLYCPVNPLPFRVDSILVGMLFVLIGFKAKNVVLFLCETKRRAILCLIISVFILLLFEIFYVDNFSEIGMYSINANRYGKTPILFIVSGVTGALMLLSISRLLFIKHASLMIMSNGLICYLALHKSILFSLRRIYNADSVNEMFLISIFVFALLYPITKFINKYSPALNGFRKI